MAQKKRGNTWHTDFTVDGQRYRQSLETSDWREAQKAEKDLIAKASQGKLAAKKHEIAKLTFKDAAKQVLEDKRPRMAQSSIDTAEQRVKPINQRFGSRKVSRITVEDIAAYMRERSDQGIANGTINRELDVIRGVLKKAKRWHLFADDIKPLPVSESIGQAMSHDEKLRLLHAAGSNPEWQNARLAMVLALCTTMRGIEIKNLRWKDVDFFRHTLTVRRSKTEAGLRSIPLNDDAWGAILELRERSQVFKDAGNPEHYLFPSCERNHIDPTRPMKTWRTSWRKMTRLIQCPQCRKPQQPAAICRNKSCEAWLEGVRSPLHGLRFHDTRHHAITELAESQASDSTVMALAGHVSKKMMDLYSHIRQHAKREAVNVLSARVPQKRVPQRAELPAPASHGTNHGTNDNPAEITHCPVNENIGQTAVQYRQSVVM